MSEGTAWKTCGCVLVLPGGLLFGDWRAFNLSPLRRSKLRRASLAGDSLQNETDGTDAAIPQFAHTRRYRRHANSVVCGIVSFRQEQSTSGFYESFASSHRGAHKPPPRDKLVYLISFCC